MTSKKSSTEATSKGANRMDKKKLDELTADHELWDKRELGASYEHFAVVTDEAQREIEEGFGLQLISLRLNRSLIEQFKELARLEGIGYQPLMRNVLIDYAKSNEHRLIALLTASEVAKRAENAFLAGIKLRDEIAELKPLSNDRIHAESAFSRTLSEARVLFSRVVENCKNPVMLEHAKLRLEQIAELCIQELQPKAARKNGRAKKAV